MVDARKVILVSHAAGLCGAERSLLDLASGMQRQGLTPIVIVRGDGPLTDELVRLGIEYHPMQYHAWIGRGNARLKALYRHCCNLYAANRAAVLFKGRGIAMVYINTTVSPFGAMLAKSLKVPAVWHLREWLESFDGGTAAALKTVDRYADLVIANSDALRSELERYILTFTPFGGHQDKLIV